MRLTILLLLASALALAGCRPQAANPAPAAKELPATEGQPAAVGLPEAYSDLGQSPELENEVWINTPEPLRLAGLRGKVVLIDMWTFG